MSIEKFSKRIGDTDFEVVLDSQKPEAIQVNSPYTGSWPTYILTAVNITFEKSKITVFAHSSHQPTGNTSTITRVGDAVKVDAPWSFTDSEDGKVYTGNNGDLCKNPAVFRTSFPRAATFIESAIEALKQVVAIDPAKFNAQEQMVRDLVRDYGKRETAL